MKEGSSKMVVKGSGWLSGVGRVRIENSASVVSQFQTSTTLETGEGGLRDRKAASMDSFEELLARLDLVNDFSSGLRSSTRRTAKVANFIKFCRHNYWSV